MIGSSYFTSIIEAKLASRVNGELLMFFELVNNTGSQADLSWIIVFIFCYY